VDARSVPGHAAVENLVGRRPRSERTTPAFRFAANASPHAIEQIDERDWRHLRAVRLEALAESPAAFGSTLEREQRYDEGDWREWARNAATFLAFDGGVPVGMAAGIEGSSVHERELIAMWVHPAHRGIGVSSALLGSVTNWARAQGAIRVTLWVTRTNNTAANLYLRAGFAATGDSKPLPSNPALIEDQLAQDLR
jgi:GNAT superfamily N-acetyltransferase